MNTIQPDNLQDDARLAQSEVVANSRMNRERNVTGKNSYAQDLAFNPLQFLLERLQTQHHVCWLDLCCGTGNALIQTALRFEQAKLGARVSLLGLDLVDFFSPYPAELSSLRLVQASVSSWNTDDSFDLITCVHGLHYIGDKLGLLQRAASWLTDNGMLLAHLDYANLHLDPDKSAVSIGKDLKQAGFEYRPKKRLLLCQGRKKYTLPYRYLGADDRAGPNYTGQPAVNSYYTRIVIGIPENDRRTTS